MYGGAGNDRFYTSITKTYPVSLALRLCPTGAAMS